MTVKKKEAKWALALFGFSALSEDLAPEDLAPEDLTPEELAPEEAGFCRHEAAGPSTAKR